MLICMSARLHSLFLPLFMCEIHKLLWDFLQVIRTRLRIWKRTWDFSLLFLQARTSIKVLFSFAKVCFKYKVQLKRSLNPPNFHSRPTNSISYKNWHIQLKFDNLFRLMRLKLRSWEVNEVARVTLIKKFNQKSCNLQFLNFRIDFTLKKKEKNIYSVFQHKKKNG